MAEIASAVIAGAVFLTSLYEKLNSNDYTSKDPEEIGSDLDDAMGRLNSLVEDRKSKFEWGKGDRKKQTKTYEHWEGRVKKLQGEVKNLEDEDKRKKAKWLKNPLSNLVGRMKNMAIKAIDLFMERLDDLGVPMPPKRVELMTAPSIEEYPTLRNSLQSILDHLKDHSKFDCIRVQGEFGVGKTTIMKNLNNHKDVADNFDLVIWVNVSDEENVKNFDISKMQKEIADRLNIKMESEVDFKGIMKFVLKKKRCLFLLNRVSGELNFEDIGIFHHDDYLGSKIVFTSRFNRVCHRMVTESVEVKRLPDPEAQKMFLKFLVEEIFLQYMQDVFEYCSRLPYIIENLACAFKDRKSDDRKWQEGLDNLRHYPNSGDGSITSVSQFIEFCYNELTKEEKDCFLYSALNQGEIDINVNYLLDCWAAVELYGTNEDRSVGNNILNKLKKASLIGESECRPREYVRIYKFAWQMARLKLRADDGVWVETGTQDRPDVEDWKQKRQISMVDVELGSLPYCPNSPNLLTLFLQRNKSLDTIPSTFFAKMENLRVLNLQHTGIISPPTSLTQLKKLKVFYLNGCTSLLKLPTGIQQMESLEVLDTRGTGLEIIQDSGEPSCGQRPTLPSIEPLRRLKRLLVSLNASDYQKARQHVLQYFCRTVSNTSATLEELIIHVNSFQNFCDEMINDVKESVATMKKLRLLKFQFIDGAKEVIVVDDNIRKTFFPEAGDLASHFKVQNYHKPRQIQVYVGCSISSPQILDIKPYQSYLKICDAQGFNCPLMNSPEHPLFEAFELVNHRDLEHLSKFETARLTGVKACLIEGCNKLEAIADGHCITDDSPMLPVLQELYLKKLQLLKSIWKGPWKSGSLVELKTLLIEGCNKLETIVDGNCIMDDSLVLQKLQKLYLKKLQLLKSIWKGPWKAGSLVKLETLEIEDCIGIEGLVTADHGTSLNLPNLKKLILTKLPNLKKICANVECEWLALEELQMDRCEIYELPFKEEKAKNLKKLVLVNLPSLTISATDLVDWPALEELHIDGCDVIFELPIHEGSMNGLKKLTLVGLRKLITLGGNGTLGWPALEKLEIRGCPLLTRLPFDNNSALNLKYIIASKTWLDSLQWSKEDDNVKQRLQKLHRLF